MDLLEVEKNKDLIFKKEKKGAATIPAYQQISIDKKYIIRSITVKEKKQLLAMVDKYVLHLKDGEGQISLVNRIYGIFRIKKNKEPKTLPVDLIVYQNIQNHYEKSKKFWFELKGFTGSKTAIQDDVLNSLLDYEK